ncbi:MAG: sensor histidine kinase [Lachnospiraceae bacterium]|nr:sensor histidine kinase [Lachnospiraceae bacterium]MCI9107470.1 sensor histidine kinase [Lachnospiraceae bacterium]MCI9342533.1 sensor histidine kinase [Lachnospiraceae bacterium]GFH90048.1 sensor histidine kinase YpdA [Lachnospiraceae bacterium]
MGDKAGGYIAHIFGRESSIQRKVILVYLIVAVLPIMIITLSISAIYYNNLLKSAYGLVEQNAIQHEVVVKERMDVYEDVLYELVSNKEYIELGKKINTEDEKSVLIYRDHMETLLRNSVYTHEGIRGITFLSDNGRYATYSKWYGSTNENIWSDEEARRQIHKKIQENQKLTFIAVVNQSLTEGREDYVILMGFPVKNLRSREQSGVLVIALENQFLLFEDNGKVNRENGVVTIIIDEEEKVLAGVENPYINRNYKEYLEEEYGSVKRITEQIRKISGTEWTIVNVIDKDVYRKDIYKLVWAVIILVVVVTCAFFLIVYFVSSKYIQTIQKIAQGIHDYEGTGAKQIHVDVDEKDELYTIVRQFNTMTARVNSLVETLRQRNEEVKAAAISQKHAEIKALEAQINPHFLFNTLDSINWRAIEHDEEEISNMLGTLGSLLRYSVSNIEMMVVLEAEISWLKKYIFLQRDRFHDSFDCQYDINEGALSFPIYKMLLQPIVENTILHAFEEVKEGGMIEVKAFVRGDKRLEIHIKDNGCGIRGDVLKELKKEMHERGPLDGKHIGISNVVHRLRIYYGEKAEIEVSSQWGEGTEFILVIPDIR